MICGPLKTYLVFFAVQLVIRYLVIGMEGTTILGVIPFAAILYLLCIYKYFTVANILVGLTILIGVYADMMMLIHSSEIHKDNHD